MWCIIPGRPSITPENSALSTPKTSLVSPELEPMRHGRKIKNGVCILNTLASLKCMFNIHFSLFPESAEKPVSLQTFHCHRTQSSKDSMIYVSPGSNLVGYEDTKKDSQGAHPDQISCLSQPLHNLTKAETPFLLSKKCN